MCGQKLNEIKITLVRYVDFNSYKQQIKKIITLLSMMNFFLRTTKVLLKYPTPYIVTQHPNLPHLRFHFPKLKTF